ncbi:NAD-dependent succinate-semialdehyde dehydrogenase [Candidatus Micrarchaeota archaeon]|nr:NAD-dependent succinate-semialdehyde dehydrogenase [Candidatus Micrarchaeota archaeon]
MNSINPATEELMKSFDCLNEVETIEEVKKSRKIIEEWKKKPISERLRVLKKAGDIIKKNSRRYGELMTNEMGKPIKQAIGEAEKCAWVCDYYFENAEKFLADEIVQTENKKSFVAFEPLGIILGVMPWNFPFWQVFRFAVPALAAGNVCLLKHSSNVPQCALAIEELFLEAGLPRNVFKTLLISGRDTGIIIEKDLVDGVSLTGSVEAGKRIGEVAGRNLKKFVLELGGSDPFIVLEDADVKFACETGVNARFQNNGQSCIAAKRFIVHEAIAGEFKEKIVKFTKEFPVGDPSDEKTIIGPLARDDLRVDLERQLKMAVGNGAKVLTGGKRISGKGYFFEPTVIEVKPGNPILDLETFGPLMTIVVGKNTEEIIKIANSTEFGLGASIWTNDLKKAEELARRIDAGLVFVNGMVKSDPRLPFGGIKKSGIGRELSHYGIREFVNIKTVVIN